MKHQRAVTEADFRQPEFRTAKVEDYEFDNDGRPVRKDRWETAIRSILGAVGLSARQGFEVSQVVDAVRAMAKERNNWETEDFPDRPSVLDIKLKDGSILAGVTYNPSNDRGVWRHYELHNLRGILAGWRESAPVATPDE